MELMIVAAVLVVLAAFVLASLGRARPRAARLTCTNHLKQMVLAFRSWSLDHDDKFPWQVSVTNGGTKEFVETGSVYVHFLVLSNELNSPKLLICPTETSRTAATNWSFLRNRNISYFVAPDATNPQPQTILSGDDNFTINGVKPKSGLVSWWTNDTFAWMATRHMNQGNICLGDGSVQASTSKSLTGAFQGSELATNRLVIP